MGSVMQGLISVAVRDLRDGSLVAEVEVVAEDSAAGNPAGELLKALASVAQGQLSVGGEASDVTVSVGGVQVSARAEQCRVRAQVEPCPTGHTCQVDMRGVAGCSPPREDEDGDLPIAIGFGVGAGCIFIFGLIGVAVCACKRRKAG